MLRKLFWATPLLLLAAGASSPASAAAQETGQNCQQQQESSGGRSLRRGILGGIARGALGRFGGTAGSLATSYLPVGELLDEAISSLLDCREQQKAAGATQQVVEQAERGGVGTTASWESETRPGVRGSSTVTAQQSDGCMTVTDVVIVDGEETRAPKQMCRRPPSNRYVRV